jgi:hypothetical protein
VFEGKKNKGQLKSLLKELAVSGFRLEIPLNLNLSSRQINSLFAAACCGCNPAAAAASTVFFSLWIAAAAVQTAATVSACSQPNTPKQVRFSIR